MRIIIICLFGDPFLPAASIPHSGGFNADTLELIEYMMGQKEWECIIITNKSEYITEYRQCIGSNIEINRIDIPNKYMNNQNLIPEFYPNILAQIEDVLNSYDNKPQLIHSYYWLSGKVACDLKTKYNIPFVHSVVSLSYDKTSCGEAPNSNIQFEWEKEFLRASDYIMTISDAECQRLIEIYKIPTNKIVIVGRSVNTAFEYPIRNPDGTPSNIIQNKSNFSNSTSQVNYWNNGVFLYMGRLKIIKGIDYIFKAWYLLYSIYKEDTPPLWIVGGNPKEIEDIRKIIFNDIMELEFLEKIQKIVWWGYLNAEGISTLLLKTLVLVTHSKYEAGGRIIIEAMSSRTPVISTPTGFGADYIKDWYNGFTVPYSNVKLLAHRMRHFIIQPLLSNTLGNCASIVYQSLKKEWDCYKKHLIIYNALILNKKESFSVKQNDIFLQIEKKYSNSHLTTYPYYISDCNDNYIKNILLINFGDSYNSFKKIKWNLWVAENANEKIIIKKLSSKLIIQTIWCPITDPNALTPHARLNKVLECSIKYTPSLCIKRYCDTNYILVIEYCTPLSELPNFAKVIECLLTQKKILQPYNEEVLTRRSVLNMLHKAAQISISLKWCEYWNEIGLKFKEKIKNIPVSDYGFCYGKSYIEHLVEKENKFYLLPSDTIFVAEWGYDFAEFLTEYYVISTWNINDYMAAYNLILHKTSIPNHIFLELCLCSLAMKILKTSVLLFTIEEKISALVKYLLEY